jgi:DNA-directed RNA polymerase subunit RPC12/RpoP
MDTEAKDKVWWIAKTRPIAKKDYVCFSCGKPIPKGTKHAKHIYTEGGKLKSKREHLECPY